ncbi:alpha-L-glutamate ligase-like protein [Candidatus Collierbacteria bacterium CG09_land_8_20_14_0_10_46_12]|uniref:Alpha-L-glutamate ligase-like protein n=2 Tax=Candidatus Collieribacteriota TaxID=1752725 RepID=A0A2H0X063_9BACT|nr:MAG: alpha-L-glutamate ligase-like protein [Candidatus Collierbacteria bacterium CG09_land_8_20_14_0_10_46_12]
MKIRDVLGLNSRNHLYTSVYNSRIGKTIANSKLFTKKTLKQAKVRVPETFEIINSMEILEKFDFLKLKTDFVVKPNNGLGGQGIIVIEKQGEFAGEWIDSTGEIWRVDDLRLHIADILAGRYSMDDVSDIAYIEERVRVHPIFEKYSYHGTPDIRVIVFNRIPIMSYVRLPTEESGGRANLFQGAAAVGIDIATGITTYGVHHAKATDFFPGTRRKLANIQIPQWEEILTTAIVATEAIGLGYMACDIVLQPDGDNSTPMILEVNAQPGLKIQIANRAGLKERLARVKGLKIVSPRHGIRVAQALFADPKLAEKGLGRKSVGRYEEIEIVGLNGHREKLMAKIDTGADISSLDIRVAEDLGLMSADNVLYESSFYNSLGKKKRKVVGITYYLSGRKVKSRISITDRSRMSKKMLIGWLDLSGFAVVVE